MDLENFSAKTYTDPGLHVHILGNTWSVQTTRGTRRLHFFTPLLSDYLPDWFPFYLGEFLRQHYYENFLLMKLRYIIKAGNWLFNQSRTGPNDESWNDLWGHWSYTRPAIKLSLSTHSTRTNCYQRRSHTVVVDAKTGFAGVGFWPRCRWSVKFTYSYEIDEICLAVKS